MHSFKAMRKCPANTNEGLLLQGVGSALLAILGRKDENERYGCHRFDIHDYRNKTVLRFVDWKVEYPDGVRGNALTLVAHSPAESSVGRIDDPSRPFPARERD